jgi:G3E family GTPase
MIGVKIVTGFLGAGKTTFINALIKANPEVRYGIIENEFGQENIDSKLLLKSQLPIIEMTNGCICCSINDELYDALNLFYEKRDEFDELMNW